MSQEQKALSTAIYCMSCKLTNDGEKQELVNKLALEACRIWGIPYPPEKLT